VSDNFPAEMLVKELGAVQAEHGTTAAGVGVITGALGVGVGREPAAPANGSNPADRPSPSTPPTG